MSNVAQDLPVSKSLWDDLDYLKEAKVGDVVVVVGTWMPMPIEKATPKYVTIAGAKFRRSDGDMVSPQYANCVPRILPLTTRTAELMEHAQ